MDKLTFDHFHPNAGACTNACDEAEAGNLKEACAWLTDAQTALEYPENSDDYDKAVEYVQQKADEAGVLLETKPWGRTTLWSVANS